MLRQTLGNKQLEATPSVADIRDQLERIVTSAVFKRSDRMIRFLRFVVEETLAGREGALKEAVIGTRVFDREAGYNPASDPVVRVEARRLRAKLDKYNRGEGSADPVVIELPKGSYAPLLRTARATPGAPGRGFQWVALAGIAGALAVAVGFVVAGGKEPAPPTASVAVLPIVNLTPDKRLDYFCDGLTEQLIFSLSRVPELRVPGRTSSFQFRQRGEDLRAIGKALGVQHILEGSVRSEGTRLRIGLQLIGVENGYHLWAHTFERELGNAFALQDEMGRAVVNALGVRLAGRLPSRRFSENTEAVRMYIESRRRWFEGDFEEAIVELQRAIAQDPAFALAYAALARAHARAEAQNYTPGAPSLPLARMAVSRALEIDGNLVDSVLASAIIHVYEWDWRAAEREFLRALATDPRSAETHGEYAIGYLAPMGRLEEALRETAISVELEPVALEENNRYGNLLRWNGRVPEAIAQLTKTLEIAPHSVVVRNNLGRAYLQARDYNRAMECFRGNPAWTAISLALSGRREEALRIRLDDAATPLTKAAYNLALNNKTESLNHLDNALRARAPGLPQIASDPFWQPLRSERRFRQLLKRMGLPES